MITLATLPEATEREVFEQVKTHLLTQNKKSKASTGKCVYKNFAGLKCAAGCLIAHKEYKPEMEGFDWWRLCSEGLAPRTHQDLIKKLQVIHDEYEPINWEQKLNELETTLK